VSATIAERMREQLHKLLRHSWQLALLCNIRKGNGRTMLLKSVLQIRTIFVRIQNFLKRPDPVLQIKFWLTFCGQLFFLKCVNKIVK
jgi:hypothetical protein